MGCGVSNANQPEAVREEWGLKSEAIRIFRLADSDGDGKLNLNELRQTLKNPTYAETAMTNLDIIDHDGKCSLAEWLVGQKTTFDKSETACKAALKMTEKYLVTNLEKAKAPANDAEGETKAAAQQVDILGACAVDHLAEGEVTDSVTSNGSNGSSGSWFGWGNNKGGDAVTA